MRQLAVRCCVILSLLLSLLASAAPTQTTFTFDASALSPRPTRMHLAGSFNGWSREATPMTDNGQGVWSVTLTLDEGMYQYKFVADGEKWITDPKGDKELEQDDNRETGGFEERA